MESRQTRTNTDEDKTRLTKRLVRQMLRGYKRVNKITETERRAWLERLTIEEARRIFDDLHQNADDWKKYGGNMKALEQRRIASKIEGRQLFMRLSRRLASK